MILRARHTELVRVVPRFPTFFPESNLVLCRSCYGQLVVTVAVDVAELVCVNLSLLFAVYALQLLGEVGLFQFSDVAEENIDVFQ